MSTPITAIPGIGASTADLLANHGFKSAESIAATSVENLSLVPGFGEIRSANTIKAAADLLGTTPLQGKVKKEKVKKENTGKKDKKNKDKKKKKDKKDKKGKKKDKKDKKKNKKKK
jgi:hypothetical protein